MKQALLTILTAICWLIGAAQDRDLHLVPKEKMTDEIYLSKEFCAHRGLVQSPSTPVVHAWHTAEKNAPTKQVLDFRWYFKSGSEATNYLKKNILALSERGESVSNYDKAAITGVTNLAVYKEPKLGKKERTARPFHQWTMLFTIDNYLAKTMIISEKEIDIKEALQFGAEAAKRLKEGRK
jgi:hypothetical protein